MAEEPYYANNWLVRNNIREDQSGINLLLDIGVTDTTTYQPFDQAFVEFSSAISVREFKFYCGCMLTKICF